MPAASTQFRAICYRSALTIGYFSMGWDEVVVKLTLTRLGQSGKFLSAFRLVWFIAKHSNCVNSSKNLLSSSVNDSIWISSKSKLLNYWGMCEGRGKYFFGVQLLALLHHGLYLISERHFQIFLIRERKI